MKVATEQAQTEDKIGWAKLIRPDCREWPILWDRAKDQKDGAEKLATQLDILVRCRSRVKGAMRELQRKQLAGKETA